MTQTPDVPDGSTPDPSPAKPRRKRRIWLWVLLMILLLLGGGRGWLAYRAHVELERYRAAGHPTTLAEYEAKYPPPPGRNGWEELEHTGAYFNKLSDEQMDLVGGDLPEPGEPWPQDVREAVEKYLALNAPMMQAARESMRADYFRRTLTLDDPINSMLPSLSWARRFAQLIKLEHVVHRDHWSADRQMEAFNENIRLAQAVSGDPSIIGQLVCISIQAIALTQAQWMLESDTLSDSQLRVLEQAVVAMDQPARWVQAYEMEAIWAMTLMDNPLPGAPTGAQAIDRRLSRLIGRADADRMVYLPLMLRLLDILALPDARVRLAKLRALGQEIEESEGHSTADILLGSVTSAAEHSVRYETKVRCARTGVAVERYRREHGSLPAALGELVPAYLGKVPDDPFRPEPDQSLGYVRGGEGFRVYTVDKDGVDDGGRFDTAEGAETIDLGFSVRMRSLDTSPATAPTTQAQDGP